MNVTPETTIATLIQGYQRDRTLVPERWPHVEGTSAHLSVLGITLRVLGYQDPVCPRVELGIMPAFEEDFYPQWGEQLHPEDMEAMAALLLQEAQKARAARG